MDFKRIMFIIAVIGMINILSASAQSVFVPPQEKFRIKNVIGDYSLDTSRVTIESSYWDAYGTCTITLDETDKLNRFYSFSSSTKDTVSCMLYVPQYYKYFIGFGYGAIVRDSAATYAVKIGWEKFSPGDTFSSTHTFSNTYGSYTTFPYDSLSYVHEAYYFATNYGLGGNHAVPIQIFFTRDTGDAKDTASNSLDVLFIDLIFTR